MAITVAKGGTPARLVWRRILLNLLNPKLALFFLAVIPQFLPKGAGLADLAFLGRGFTVMIFANFLPCVGLTATARAAFPIGPADVQGQTRRPRLLRRASFVAPLTPRLFRRASYAAPGARLALERAP